MTFGLVGFAGTCAVACACSSMPVGNSSVPQPAQPVELKAYSGVWYELGRYENRFEKDCEGVTAEYRPAEDGSIEVINTCHKGSVGGPIKISHGKAKPVENSRNAKLEVTFFGPFYFGNYWVLDRADDYSWSIVGEPSGKYLWLLTREAVPSDTTKALVEKRVREMGYDLELIRFTEH